MKLSAIRWAIACCITLSFISAASAAPITVNFTYSGTGSGNETASGMGSFTYNGNTLTGFNFADTLTVGGVSDDFVYGFSDVSSSSINPGSGFSQLVITILTKGITGDNTPVNASFFLAYSAANPGYGATIGTATQANTSGNVVLTQAAATPEPSTMSLFGLAGAGLFASRRRFRR